MFKSKSPRHWSNSFTIAVFHDSGKAKISQMCLIQNADLGFYDRKSICAEILFHNEMGLFT